MNCACSRVGCALNAPRGTRDDTLTRTVSIPATLSATVAIRAILIE